MQTLGSSLNIIFNRTNFTCIYYNWIYVDFFSIFNFITANFKYISLINSFINNKIKILLAY